MNPAVEASETSAMLGLCGVESRALRREKTSAIKMQPWRSRRRTAMLLCMAFGWFSLVTAVVARSDDAETTQWQASGEKSVQGRSVDTRIDFEVFENQPIGTVVGVIPIKPNFTYRFNEQPAYFALNSTTGVITTTRVLDRESLSSDKFDFVILSSLPTYPIEVRITVVDVNDNAPVFPEASILVSFSESASAGTRVILDTATDGDIGDNDVTTDYRIVDDETGDVNTKFRLVVTTNPSGETPYLHLESTGSFDRETQGFYQLNISARDGGNPPKFGFLLVNVTILDVNDNPPIFDHSDYVVSLNESVSPGSRVLQVTATDVDEGDNARMTYYLADAESQFAVDPDTGEITTTRELSCQADCQAPAKSCPKSCVFTVFARDHGSPRQDGRTYVTVNLLDTNDHDPIIRFRYFPANGKFATVDENAQNGSVVAAVSVIDLDEGPNGETSVEIKAGNELNHFKLDSTPSFDIVRVNGVLDREKVSRYNLTIMAEDKGSPKRTSTAFLIIQVNDINDHEPVFEKSEYSATFSELAPIGTYVAGITATDEDSGINSNIFYAIVSGNDQQWFDIDSYSGLVTTKAQLNREMQDTVTLKISARDGGPSPKWAYTRLKIQILDENDEAPVFEQSVVNVSLSESTASNTVVATLIAKDEDQGTNGTVTYHFHSDVEYNYPGIFSIAGSSGRVSTRTKLDREAMPKFELKVIARDQGVPPLSSTATIYLTVEDVNDNSPEFYPRHYFFNVDEKLKPGEEFGLVSAFDKDEGKNAEVTYFFVNGSPEFEIDADTGVLKLASSVVINRKKKQHYRLVVSAKDTGNRKALEDAVVHVAITSSDSSDDSIVKFSAEEGFTFRVTEDSGETATASKLNSSPKEIGRVRVTTSVNPQYFITDGDPDRLFDIRTSGDVGVIETRRKIDREATPEFNLRVVALVVSSDVASFAETWVNVTVDDVNDNAPSFAQARSVAYILEDSPIGHEVYLARAHDSDDAENARVTYELSSNPGDMFYISPHSGMIHLNKRIGFEKEEAAGVSGLGETLNRVYNLEVQATDAGSPALSSRQFINVFVQDVNDHTPAFSQSSYETSLLESTAVNSRFFSLTATDVDIGMNSRVEYSIVDGNEEGRFGIFPDGMLYLKRGLDRESRDYYGLTVVAKDGGTPVRSSSASVVVRVIDENDNRPEFANETFNFYLRENEIIDTYVGRLTAMDKDIGRNSELFYSISSSMGLDFTIDSKSGVIKTLKSFDREEVLALSGRDWMSLDAVVTDNGVTRLRDEATVLIHIIDVNDNAPKFARNRYKANVLESAAPGTKILEVSAEDDDSGDNGRVTYALVAGNDDGAFNIDAESGLLTLKKNLDRERQDSYDLIVEARDDASPPSARLSSSASIRIQILDVNDNAPVFLSTSSKSIKVSEKAEVGTVLTKFEAMDADLGMNRVMKYHIFDGNVMDMFVLDPDSGVLRLGKYLDFERESVYNLNITASDSGHPRLHAWTMCEIRVQDANDNPPAFPNTAIVRQIQEGIPVGTPIVTVAAEDPDSGRNGEVVYSIRSQSPAGDHFGINPKTGIIFTAKPIDREAEDNFRLMVVATDVGEEGETSLSSEKLVTIIVEDVNDNAPYFTSLSSGLLRAGTTTGTKVFAVTAKDVDSNTNGLVTYDLLNSAEFSGLFSVDRSTGQVTVTRDVPTPARPTYELQIRATDEAVQSQRKSSETRVTLIGVPPSFPDGEAVASRLGPKFSQQGYSATVNENETIGTTVTRVTAKYSDNLATEIEYHLLEVVPLSRGSPIAAGDVAGIDGAPFFAVDRNRGTVVTAAILDRESGIDEYRLKVLAVVPSPVAVQTAETMVKVSVIDKNDTPPSWDGHPSVFTVSEDLLPGQPIATVRAVDADTVGHLTYELVSPPLTSVPSQRNGNDSLEGAKKAMEEVFAIDPSRGVISLLRPLDREMEEKYSLVVRANDGVQFSDFDIIVKVMDSNDNAPAFDEPCYSIEVDEDQVRGAVVGSVHAEDADKGANGLVSYSVISDWANDVFSLNPVTGVFTLASRLDYEQVQHYIFVVEAKDAGQPSLSSTVSVYFNVIDLNDNAPVFDPMSFSDRVYENTTIGSPVITVAATDQDSGLNGKLVYSLEEEGDDNDPTFGIYPENGTIYTMKELDRERRASYSLTVIATDQSPAIDTRLSSSIQVTVIIEDVNDVVPEFVGPNVGSVTESALPNTVVMAVKAKDTDEGRNSYVEYFLERGSGKDKFELGPVDGLIRVRGSLDRETTPVYYLQIVARDRGTPSLSASTTITINVLDANDNAPMFDPRHYSATVPENATIGLSVLQVSATDLDADLNGRIRYAIVEGDSSRDFIIAEDTGVIRVAKTLNFENHPHYVITVQAEDSGQEVMYDSATVSITVTDMNDNAPLFLDSPYVIFVREEEEGNGRRAFAETDAKIGKVTAYDADGPPHNRITYLLKEGDKDKFAIDMSTGDIKLKSGLDREQQSYYELIVAAMDTGTPRLTGTGTVKIIVNDVNDHSPAFDSARYIAKIPENSPAGTSVIHVHASDADEGANAVVTYSLLDDHNGKFTIDPEDGTVRAGVPLDREDIEEYLVTIIASDSALSDSRTSYANLTVVVLDVNDNAPKFLCESSVARVPDPLEQGAFVYGCEVNDADAGQNGDMYFFLDGPDADFFTVDETTGIVTASQRLESLSDGKKFSIIVQVVDKGQPEMSSAREVEVLLNPAAEFPLCDEFTSTLSFPEDEPIGTKVGRARGRSRRGAKGAISYRIVAGNPDASFAIDSTNGEIFVGNRLDHELRNHYDLWIEARDSTVDPPLGTVVKLSVNVTDVNDNPPMFDEFVYHAFVMEEEFPPKLVTKVHATDRDTGDNQKVMYRIDERLSPSIAPIFEINPDSGEIYSKVKLDRERIDKYSFIVEAVDHGEPQKTGTSVVVVTVVDKNDNPPRFTRLFSVNVTENAPIGTFVIQVTSSDKDVGPNGNATYSFTENPGGKFNIDGSSGNVTVAGHIDREVRQEYALKVSAVDGSWRAETPLTITVLDENDNAPVFERDFYRFNLPEMDPNVTNLSGIVVGTVKATDKDKVGQNSALSYSLKHPSDYFAVDPASGKIYPKRLIAFEGRGGHSSPENEYAVKVIAIDQGKPPMSSECTVSIAVVKANKNAPKFLRDEYASPVPETALFGQRVVQVTAIDADYNTIDIDGQDEVEKNGITYEAVGGNGTDLFNVDGKSGWVVTTQPLLGRRNSVFVLVVRAIDDGIPPLYQEVRVTLVVTGQNRFSPVFVGGNRPHQVSVEENAALGKPIITITATDDDGNDNPNGIVQYYISSGNDRGKFAINARSGTLTVAEGLDFDTVSQYIINVTASDSGFLQNSAETSVVINVIDVNDNAPQFVTSLFTFEIKENSPLNSFVGKVEATDADSSPFNVIRYSIKDPKAKSNFKINPESGEILSRASFDYEQASEFSFDVFAWNPDAMDSMVGTARVVVKIIGENEFYPKFVQSSFQFTVSESAKIGEVAGRVEATDADKGPDGDVYYLLVGSSNDRGFYVKPETGEILVARHLDREIQSRVVLTVLAKNGGSIMGNDTDEAQVIISIEDGNDPPAFTRDIYSKTIPEDANINTVVLAVKAVDKDVRPDNNQFSYSILRGNVGQVFSIHPISGVIQLVGQLDRETESEYNLVIGAIDTGNPPETGTATVNIIVEDANDNAPEFETQELTGFVTENRGAGASVVVLRPFDKDGDKNGAPFTFSIIGGDEDVLTVNPRTGVVRTATSIDRESTPMLKVDVQVEDNGTPKLKSIYPLTVEVLDENDSPSTPRTLEILVQPFAGQFPGGLIADVRPNDLDSTGNYNCRLVSSAARLRVFSIPDGCNLHMSPPKDDLLANGNGAMGDNDPNGSTVKSYRLSVIGNDGRHPDVTSIVTVKFQSISVEALTSSATVRISNITGSHFLQNYYRAFTESIKNSLNIGEELVLFSVADVNAGETSDQRRTDVSLTLGVKTTDGYVRPAPLLEENRARLQQIFGVDHQVSVNFDPCRRNPCEHGGSCMVTGAGDMDSYKFDAVASFKTVSSPDLVITGPEIVKDFECKCKPGFEGKTCNQRRDPCFPNPCLFEAVCSTDPSGTDFQCQCPGSRQGKRCEKRRRNACEEDEPCKNGGSCRVTDDEVGFFCLCRSGYRGRNCEVTSESCRPNPCLNGGTCVDLKPGYRCQCPSNYFGTHCGESSFGFSSLSYMTFPSLDPTTNDISITFSTNKPNGLLLYNFGLQTGGRSDFVAVEIVGGRPKFSYGGARTAISSIAVEKYVADSRWYKVTATRNSRVMSLSVANCSHQASSSAFVCHECPDSSCYVDDTGTIGTLNFNGKPLYVGGVDSMAHARERPGQIVADDFVGCVESLVINGRSVNLSDPTASRGITDTCNRRNVCDGDANPCGPNGMCLDRWDRAVCKCDNGLSGPDCGDVFRPISVTGNGFVNFKITESLRRRHYFASDVGGEDVFANSVRWRRQSDSLVASAASLYQSAATATLSFKFRTVDQSGVLLHATSAVDYTLIYIQDGILWYSSKIGQNYPVNMTLSNGQYGPMEVADGVWHNLTLVLSHQSLTFALDSRPVGDELDPNTIHNFMDPYLTSLTFGGTHDPVLLGSEMDTSYQGCLSTFVVDEQVQVLNGTGLSMLDSQFFGQVEFGCSASVLGAAAATDPLSIGVTLVIVFFVILLVAILVSFVVFRFKKRTKRTNKPTRPGIQQHVQHHMNLKQNGSNGNAPTAPPVQNQTQLQRGGGPGDVQGATSNGMNGAQEATVVVGRHHVHQDSGYVENGDMLGDDNLKFHLAGKKCREMPIGEGVDGFGNHDRYQTQSRPDLLESREVVNKSPGGLSYHSNGLEDHLLRSRDLGNMGLHMGMGMDIGISEPPEHYDLENASSIAPSDIDPIYHYRGYRDGNVRKYNKHHPTGGRSSHGPSPLNFPPTAAGKIPERMLRRQSPSLQGGAGVSNVGSGQKMQSTPLARLSPSSELSQQTGPRILTLQDISGKPLQRALLAASPSRPLNSERSLNSPVSHLTSNSSTTATGSFHSSKKNNVPQGVGVLGVSGVNKNNASLARPRNSSLVSALDAVSTSSSDGDRSPHPPRRPGKFAPPPPTPPSVGVPDKQTIDTAGDSSTDESGNDSFTCSEFEYDTYEKVDDDNSPPMTRKNSAGKVVEPRAAGDGNEIRHLPPSFRGSLSTLVASDDDISQLSSTYKTPNGGAGWDYFLNWGPNFDNLVGVFKDIAALPDSSDKQQKTPLVVGGAPPPMPPPSNQPPPPPPNPNEEYV